MTAIGAIHRDAVGPNDEVGVSGDGRTVVTFHYGPEPSAELWDVATARNFATLRRPSAIAEVFAEDGSHLNKGQVERGSAFWGLVGSLAPKAVEGKK